jgi:membrane-associated phospholipid phosphatase
LPEVTHLTARLAGIVVLSGAFVAMTIAITAGAFIALDHQVAEAMHAIWQDSLHTLFQLIAEVGGIELTSILMLALFIYLWRGGFGADALVVGAFAGAVLLEVIYKSLFFHPGPPRSLSHADGPSLSDLLPGSGAHGNSFPSGHMVRTVVAYGLLAFVIRRLAPRPVVRWLAIPVAIVIIVVMAFDRLYLDVHWESDVIGGLLLGGIALVAATVWLDRPRKAEN